MADGFQAPTFNFTGWNPDPPAGISFLGLVPMMSGYELSSVQHTHQGKLSSQHRRRRRQNYSRSVPFGKNIIGKSLNTDVEYYLGYILAYNDLGAFYYLAEKKLLTAVNNYDATTG